MSSKLQKFITNSTEIVDCLGGLSALASEVTYNGEWLDSILSGWGFAHAFFNFASTLYSLTIDSHSASETEKYSKAFLYSGTGVFLAYASGSVCEGSKNLSLIYSGFLASSIAEFLMAGACYYALNKAASYCIHEDSINEQQTDALKSCVSKGLLVVGCSLLASTNPLGWYFIAGSTLVLIQKHVLSNFSLGLFSGCCPPSDRGAAVNHNRRLSA